MNIRRLLDTSLGRNMISILLGIGLASLFNKVCKDKNCIVFNGPILSEFDGKIYKNGEKCYKYSLNPDKCDTNKRVIEIGDPNENKDKMGTF
jgi:hypothetical protein